MIFIQNTCLYLFSSKLKNYASNLKFYVRNLKIYTTNLKIMEFIVDASVKETNTVAKAIAFYNHMEGKYPSCLNSEALAY